MRNMNAQSRVASRQGNGGNRWSSAGVLIDPAPPSLPPNSLLCACCAAEVSSSSGVLLHPCQCHDCHAVGWGHCQKYQSLKDRGFVMEPYAHAPYVTPYEGKQVSHINSQKLDSISHRLFPHWSARSQCPVSSHFTTYHTGTTLPPVRVFAFNWWR